MSTIERFQELSQLLAYSAELVANDINLAADVMRSCFADGNKVLACGNGGSAAHAQHLVAELTGRFQAERDGYAAYALTADSSVMTAVGNDYGFENVFSRQVAALGRPGDVLVAFTTSGKSANILSALRAADRRSMQSIIITGPHAIDGDDDIVINVPSTVVARIQEVHQLVIHCLCERIERLV